VVIPKDKLLHFAAGIILYLIGGIWLAVLGGAIKEIYDCYNPKKHTVELLDFIATITGGLFCEVVRWLLL